MIYESKFTEANLKGAVFGAESHFEDCEFASINFQDIVLKSSNFTNCVFKSCNLANQDLTNASFREVHFESCNLIGINWCTLRRLDVPVFLASKMNFSAFQGLKLKRVVIKDCSVIDVDFSGCDLTDSQFAGTELSGSNFNRAILLNSDFRGAKNYLFDLRTTGVKGVKLSVAEAINLIKVLGAEVEF